jgi:hypothetical protein
MADFVRVPKADWQDICDSVREKTGGANGLLSGEVAPAVRGIQSGGGGGTGLAVPKMAAVYFPIALSIPSNFGEINVDFGPLIDYLDAKKTYAYSLVLYKNSVTEYTELTHIANALTLLGRIGHEGKLSSFAFDYNNQMQARAESTSMAGIVHLNVTNAFTAKSMTNGVATLTLGSSSTSDFIGEWVGIFTAIAPFTSTEPANKLTECPANFLTYTEAS